MRGRAAGGTSPRCDPWCVAGEAWGLKVADKDEAGVTTVDELPLPPGMDVLLIGNEEGDEGSVTETQDSQVEAT